MTVERTSAVEQKHVLVGIQLDGCGRELLNWALPLVKVAEAGDRVLALQVLRDHPSRDQQVLLDGYLQVYEGLCSVKKVDLRGQVLRGSLTRKVLVREAKKVSDGGSASWSREARLCTATARYCAKRLAPTVNVFAIHHGKIVFRRCINPNLPGIHRDPRPSLYQIGRDMLKECPSEFGDSEAETETSSTGTILNNKLKAKTEKTIGGNHHLGIPSKFLYESIIQRPGWPLLRRATSEATQFLIRKNLSVVQWVMSLPDRSPYLSFTNCTTAGKISPSNYIGCTELGIDKSRSAAATELLRQSDVFGTKKLVDYIWFDYKVLRNLTWQFSSDYLIGKGGSNFVYKGILPRGHAVAIKILTSSSEAKKEFALETDIISSLKHKHITPLLGVCIHENSLISVYDFLPSGSLEKNLHGKAKDKERLSWKTRYNIALGVSEALDYLHNENSPLVIHRDVKSSNILLTEDLEPQLSDFGLAMLGPTTSPLAGTFGYLAPEYFMYGKVSDKVDVFAYGVVLLELLSGRKSISSESPKGQESIVMWAKPIMENGDIESILDPELDWQTDEVYIWRMAVAARLCITDAAPRRPKMSRILKILKGETNVCAWNDILVENENPEDNDDEVHPHSSAESHLSLAMLDFCDDYTSFSSI